MTALGSEDWPSSVLASAALCVMPEAGQGAPSGEAPAREADK
jgi:hypothetical protein